MTIKMIEHKLLGHETIEIYPISDMHVGSKEFDEASFQKLIREILSQDNRFVILAGDLIDNGLKNSVSNVYEQTMRPKEQMDYAAELLYPIRDRILCSVGGNHERRSNRETDTDPAELIAARIGIDHLYRENMAFLKIKAGERKNNSLRSPNYTIGVVHGNGGGMLLGSGLNRAEPFAQAMGVDLLIMGHTHKPLTAPTSRYEADLQKNVMVKREIRIMVSTGWLTYGGYPTQKMLRPVTIRPNKAILSSEYHDIAVLT